MENLYKQARNFYNRNKISDFEFDCVRSEIYSTNKAILSICAFVTMVLFFVLFVLSLVIKDSAVFRQSVFYAAIFLLHSAFFVTTVKLPEKYEKFTVLLMYLYIWSFNFYTIGMSVYSHPENYAVLYITFAFAYPLIFVDKSRRMFLNSLTANIIFCVLTFFAKEPANYKVDIFNCIVFYGLSYLPSFYLTKIRVREFSLRQIIESERDTDELTGLLNKAAFTRQAKKSINSAREGILIILDCDGFKQVNDTYGHFVGDHVLKLVSVCIRQTFRSSDIMGRFGGDEFIILMDRTSLTDIAMLRCNQLLERLHETKIFPENSTDNQTIQASIGFALYEGESDFDALFQKADKALYEAKNTGKDKVCQFHL